VAKSFSATIDAWVRKVEGGIEAVFKKSVEELVDQADDLLKDLVYDQPVSESGYKRTGFLRSSLKISTVSMPLANRPQGAPDTGYMAEIEAQIEGAELGETLYVGWTANYAAYVHYGVTGYGMYGHIGSRPPRPWVTMIAQRWQGIVSDKATELKGRLGL